MVRADGDAARPKPCSLRPFKIANMIPDSERHAPPSLGDRSSAPVSSTSRRSIPASTMAIIVVAAVCATALLLRTPLRSLYWAQRVISAGNNSDFATHLTLLCNAGDGARWGIKRLLNHNSPAIRQAGVVALQHGRGPWSRGELVRMMHDTDDETADLAAVGFAFRRSELSVDAVHRLLSTATEPAFARVLYALGRAAAPGDDAIIISQVRALDNPALAAEMLDALGNFHSRRSISALMTFLDDHRACQRATVSERLGQRALGAASVQTAAFAEPTSVTAPQTLGYRAARMLERITGAPAADPNRPTPGERQAWEAWSEP